MFMHYMKIFRKSVVQFLFSHFKKFEKKIVY